MRRIPGYRSPLPERWLVAVFVLLTMALALGSYLAGPALPAEPTPVKWAPYPPAGEQAGWFVWLQDASTWVIKIARPIKPQPPPDKPQFDEAIYDLVKRGGPVPPPPPPPPPPPVPTELWAIIIEESAERTPQQAIVLASPKVRAMFKGWRLFDPMKSPTEPNPVPVELQPYVDRVNNPEAHLSKPVLFLTEPKGTVYFEGPLPETIPAIEALVGKIKKGGSK